MWSDVLQRFERAAEETGASVVLRINPRQSMLPLPIQRFDEPFFPFGKTIIQATHERVAAYLFDFASYLALGAAGVIALERTIAYASALQRPTILDGPFWGPAYSVMLDELSFNLDAVTVIDAGSLESYADERHGAAFLSVSGSSEADVPYRGGLYLPDQGRLTFRDATGHVIRYQVTGDDVLYADRGYSFPEGLLHMLENLA